MLFFQEESSTVKFMLKLESINYNLANNNKYKVIF